MEIDFNKMDGLVPAIIQDAKTLKVLMLLFKVTRTPQRNLSKCRKIF